MLRGPDKSLMDLCAERADAGDSAFAIAYALLELAEAQKETALALDRMGLNWLKADGPPGALEKIAMEAERMADHLSE